MYSKVRQLVRLMINRSNGWLSHRMLLGATILIAAATSYPQVSAAGGKPKITVALWVANGSDVLEFSPNALMTKGVLHVAPQLKFNSATKFGAPQGVVFDKRNDLWVVDGGNGGTIVPALDEFTPTQFGRLDSPKQKNRRPRPAVAVRSSAFMFPRQAVFDAPGNLWVSDSGANRGLCIHRLSACHGRLSDSDADDHL
jgi:hypothetical protein